MSSSTARRSTADRNAIASSSRSAHEATNEPPDYQPPSAPLNASGHQALRSIATQHQDRLIAHLRAAAEYLDSSAGQINERLTERNQAAHLKRKRDGNGEQTEESQTLAEHLSEFQPKVEFMTKRMDEALRQTIDGKEMAAQLETALKGVKDHTAGAASQVTATQRSEWDPTMPGQTQDGAAALSERFRQSFQGQKNRYNSKSLRVRYSEHPDYVKFKTSVHMALQSGEQIAPLPHKSTWFQDGSNADQDDADSDDIVMEGESIRTTCPITLAPFREPLSSDLCPHHFEKSAILELIRKSTLTSERTTQRGATQVKVVQCPTPGCDQMLSESTLSVRQSFIRTLRRLERLREARNNDYEDEEDGDGTRRSRSIVLGSDDGYADVDGDVAAGSSGPQVKVSSSAAVPPATARTNDDADNIVDLGSETDEEDEED
ncbi:zinc-finger of the MIZ type in Nse subunit-domain-containing protein [Phyllosticta citrichinensis]|uniref:Zinc-finger of the MIZ type in Nse subunit-domain-containing protein n=1 Tax=Phyllosticta citrichinensis TaxID=1130410 RepID=A0ABR1XFI4_9PEZI